MRQQIKVLQNKIRENENAYKKINSIKKVN